MTRLSDRPYPALVSQPRRGRVWRVGEYLGLVSDRPTLSWRQALKAFLWSLPLLVSGAFAAAVAQDSGAPEWLTMALRVLPIVALVALLSRTNRR